MSEKGYICLDRGALNHEFFRRKEHSEFEAWVWLLMEAAWKPRVRRLGEFIVSLNRGELVVSIRHLMQVWSWSQGKVDRFLSRLKDESMVATRADTGITVVTICNYEKYQSKGSEPDTPIDTGSDTGSDTPADTIQKKLNHLTIEEVGRGAEVAPTKKSVRRKAKPETELPSDFSLDEENLRIAAEHGFVGANAVRLFDKFCSSAKAKGRTYVNWRAAWRVWCSNQAQWDADRISQGVQAKRIPRI